MGIKKAGSHDMESSLHGFARQARGDATSRFIYSMGSQHHLETFSITEIPGISLSR